MRPPRPHALRRIHRQQLRRINIHIHPHAHDLAPRLREERALLALEVPARRARAERRQAVGRLGREQRHEVVAGRGRGVAPRGRIGGLGEVDVAEGAGGERAPGVRAGVSGRGRGLGLGRAAVVRRGGRRRRGVDGAEAEAGHRNSVVANEKEEELSARAIWAF